MKNAIILLLDNYADWEVAYVSSTINTTTEWTVNTISTQKEVKSLGGLTTKVDFLLHEIPSQIDLLILIGGNSWSDDNKEVFEMVNNSLESQIVVGAICGAVDFMARNGLLSHYKHTGNDQNAWSTYDKYTNPSDFKEEQAVKDQNLITANGTAPIEFEQLLLKSIHFTDDSEIEKMIYLQKNGFYNYLQKYGNPFA